MYDSVSQAIGHHHSHHTARRLLITAALPPPPHLLRARCTATSITPPHHTRVASAALVRASECGRKQPSQSSVGGNQEHYCTHTHIGSPACSRIFEPYFAVGVNSNRFIEMTKGQHHRAVSNDKYMKSPSPKTKEKGMSQKTMW